MSESETPIILHKEPAEGAGREEAFLAPRANHLLRAFKILGPGFITGDSDDDPSEIGTYAVAGASFGFATLWMALFTFPLMAGVQFICANIGLVSGDGLASRAPRIVD
jgi:Mn2+/Fe2+ NRAMP family transporter